MKFLRIFAFLPFLVFSHAEDMYLIKGGMTFLPDGSFAKKDILVDEGLIILVEDNIGDVGAENIIDANGKYVTPGLIVFSSLGLLELSSLPETNDTSSDIYNAGFAPSKAYNPFSQAVRLNRAKVFHQLFMCLAHLVIFQDYLHIQRLMRVISKRNRVH